MKRRLALGRFRPPATENLAPDRVNRVLGLLSTRPWLFFSFRAHGMPDLWRRGKAETRIHSTDYN